MFSCASQHWANSDVKGMTEAIGIDDYLRWIIYYHEQQEAFVSASMSFVEP